MHGRGGYWQEDQNHVIDFEQSRARIFLSEQRLHINIYYIIFNNNFNGSQLLLLI